METGIHVKRDRSKTSVAIIGMLLCVLGVTNAHAEERHSASARLRISVTVVPTLVAAQQAAQSAPQPSLSPVTFNFQSAPRNSESHSIRNFAAGDEATNVQSAAVLKTTTIVSE